MTQNVERALLLTTREGGNQFMHVEARPILVIGGDIRNPNGDSSFVRESGERELADLVISCQVERAERAPYGYAVRYQEAFSIDRVRAEAMVKQLRAIDRELEKLEREMGYAESFGAYLVRVARALKISDFLWHLKGQGTMYAQNEYHHADARGAQAWVAQKIEDYQRTEVPA